MLLCRVFIVGKALHFLPQSSLLVLCQHTTFSLHFLFGWFSTANLPPNSGAEVFPQLFQEGLGACYEAPDVFLIAGHSLGEVVGSLILC